MSLSNLGDQKSKADCSIDLNLGRLSDFSYIYLTRRKIQGCRQWCCHQLPQEGLGGPPMVATHCHVLLMDANLILVNARIITGGTKSVRFMLRLQRWWWVVSSNASASSAVGMNCHDCRKWESSRFLFQMCFFFLPFVFMFISAQAVLSGNKNFLSAMTCFSSNALKMS